MPLIGGEPHRCIFCVLEKSLTFSFFFLALLPFLVSVPLALCVQLNMFTNTITYDTGDCSGNVVRAKAVRSASCSSQGCSNGVMTTCSSNVYIPPDNNIFDRYTFSAGSTKCGDNFTAPQSREYFRDRVCITNPDGTSVRVSCIVPPPIPFYWVLENFTDSSCTNLQTKNTYEGSKCFIDTPNGNSWSYSCGGFVTNPPSTTQVFTTGNLSTASPTSQPGAGRRIGWSVQLLIFLMLLVVIN